MRRGNDSGSRRIAWAVVAVAVLGAVPNLARGQVAADFVTLDPFDMAYAGNSGLNDVSFRQNALTSVEVDGNTYQFAAYYRNTTPNNQRRITIARRVLDVSDWEVFDFTGTAFGDPNSNGTDGHNVISFGVDGEGYMHMSWGMHNNPLICRKSTAPVTSAAPISFGTTNSPMTGDAENSVTYPQFYNLPDGDLLFFYRNGASGNGNTYLNRYDIATDTWSILQHPLFDGIASSVNSYPNTLAFDSQNRIHFTWTDRSTSAFQTNHNIYYARSPNEGQNWTKMDGTSYAMPLLEAIAEVAVPISQNSSLINQTSATVDRNDYPLVASWWAPGAAQGDHTRQYMLAYYDGTAWQTSQISDRPLEPLQGDSTVRDLGRPIIVVDDDNRAIVVMRYDQRSDVVTVGYSEDRENWTLLDLTTENMGTWEPTYDAELWKRENKLHLFYHPINGAIETTASILEWDAKAYFATLGATLTLQVDRTTGGTLIANRGQTTTAISGYTLASAGSQLNPSKWSSLDSQSLAGWIEAQASPLALAESNSTGTLAIAAEGGSVTLGSPYGGAAVAFGVDAPGDLVFQYTTGGGPRTGTVEYTGQSLNNLTLFVDPATGVARLQNTSSFQVAIDAYTVASASASLDSAGWQSLDEQDAAGGQWQQANTADSRIAELQPSGSTLIAAGGFFDLGMLFQTGAGQQDLVMQFLIAGQTMSSTGVVLYTDLGIPGDYNDDGAVSASDYVVWRNQMGTATSLPHDVTPGWVTQDDYYVWRAWFGHSSASAFGSNRVPEPTFWGLSLITCSIGGISRSWATR